MISTDKVTMINTRGGLREVSSMMVEELKSQGWRQVVNPKRDYFPELDKSTKDSKQGDTDIDDEIESQNILKFTRV